jgi:riboflavin kinase/FMN adenylyltransferase
VIAVAIGVFDGVHLGHQALLARTLVTARELNVEPAVLTFDPHPTRVVAPARAPRMLYSVAERCELIRGYGIQRIVVLPFTSAIAEMTPEGFAAAHLQDAAAVLVGENFCFGRKRTGDAATLARLGFDARPLAPVEFRGVAVSSSEIRARLQAGDVSLAGRLLGRCYAIAGDIVTGHGIGSRQTVPTLNLLSGAEVLPANGVYITRTTDVANGRRWNSITNIGTRPTFEDAGAVSIETFLLSPFDGVTPPAIRLEFARRVRAERKFEGPEALRAQILRDVATAKTYFRRLHW